MNNGHGHGGNGHANGTGKAGPPHHGASEPLPGAPFFAMTRLETAALYRAISHATFADAEVRALVSRMGKSLENPR